MTCTFGELKNLSFQSAFKTLLLLMITIFAGFPVDSSLQALDIKNSISSYEFRRGPPSSSKLDVRTSDTIIVE